MNPYDYRDGVEKKLAHENLSKIRISISLLSLIT